jgi:transposase
MDWHFFMLFASLLIDFYRKERKMISLEVWMDIKLLRQQGHSIREVARLTGLSRNTVRRALRQKSPQPFQAPERKSKLDDFKSYVQNRFQECSLSAVRLLAEIQAMGYTGSVVTIRRFLQTLKGQKAAAKKMTVRFETPPGQQAQADWAYCGRFPDSQGNTIAVYVFVCVLSFSRLLFIEFTTSMKIETLIGCHLSAFQYFNGFPQSILYDNMKQVRLSQQQWNPLFLDFVDHYGIVPKTHRIRRPRTKGKVERMVDYVKDNFLNGRSFADLEDLNTQGRHWLDTTANVRLHATTKQRPIDLLAKEALTPLVDQVPYQISHKSSRKVSSEGYVSFQGSRYSVPPEQVGKLVILEQGEEKIIIRCADLIIAEHSPATEKGQTVAQPEHIEQMWKLSLGREIPKSKQWQVSFRQEVEQTDLRRYEEVSQ